MEDEWNKIEDTPAPEDGFFMVWAPDHPDLPMIVRGSIFHSGRREGTPSHISFNHFTHWRELPPMPKL